MTTLSFELGSQWVDAFNFRSLFGWREEINFAPPAGTDPSMAEELAGAVSATFKPSTTLIINNTYFHTRLQETTGGGRIFTNDIIRTKWNWQLTRPLSLRVILQYDLLDANPALTSLTDQRNFNVDLLGTYRLNPWTAVFVGYNTNARNIEILDQPAGRSIQRTGRDLQNDANQFFVKISYLFKL